MRRLASWFVGLSVALPSCSRGRAGFRDVPWGASEATLRTRIPIRHCLPANEGEPGTLACRAEGEDFKIGSVRPQAAWFFFRDDAMIGWRIFYSAEDRDIMLGAFKERYGEPTEVTQARALWRGSKGSVTLTAG